MSAIHHRAIYSFTLSLSLLCSALIFPMTIVCYVCVFVCASLCSSVLLHKSDAGAQSRLRFERIEDTVVSSTFYPAIHPKGERGGGLDDVYRNLFFVLSTNLWFFWLLFAREGRPPFFRRNFLTSDLNQVLFSERSVAILCVLFLFDDGSECVAWISASLDEFKCRGFKTKGVSKNGIRSIKSNGSILYL